MMTCASKVGFVSCAVKPEAKAMRVNATMASHGLSEVFFMFMAISPAGVC